jgi:putative phosphoribosyl transferase
LILRGLPQIPAKAGTAIVIDDGIATGATARAAVRALRKTGARRVILAVPVAPRETADEMRREADVFICLEEPDDFASVGGYYFDFTQVSDDEVIRILERFNQRSTSG